MTERTEAPADTGAASTQEALPALAQALQQWTDSVRTVLGRLFSIAILETRLAALSFVLILMLGVASGLLLASAWIALFAAVVTWFHAMGLSWPIALLLMAGINLLLAAISAYAIYRMSNNMMFRAIRQFILATETHDDKTPAAADRPQQPPQ